MQGRLVPPEPDRFQAFPRDRWAEEFGYAAAAGLGCIEWIYDTYGADVNPLASDGGIAQLQELSAAHGIALRSVCADYFMEQPLVRVTAAERRARMADLAWLLDRCARLGVTRVVLPFVDNSAIQTSADLDVVVDALHEILPAAEALAVELHLETALDPQGFRKLLDRVPHRLVRVNYDSGNSASLGYHPDDEFAAYGDRVGSVHIKDRVRGGGTVPLGTGAADFGALFAGLRKIGYSSDLILQVARGTPGDEIAWTKQNCAFVAARWPIDR